MPTTFDAKNTRPHASVIFTLITHDVAPGGGVYVALADVALGENVPPQLELHCVVHVPPAGVKV